MSEGLTIVIDDAALSASLARAIERVERPRSLLEALGQQMKERIAARLDDKLDPGGARWLPLNPKTLARKGGRGSLLIATGHMVDSLTTNASDDYAEVGFGRPYAAFHEFGTKRMPRRGLLTANPGTGELGAEDRQALLDTISLYLQESL